MQQTKTKKIIFIKKDNKCKFYFESTSNKCFEIDEKSKKLNGQKLYEVFFSDFHKGDNYCFTNELGEEITNHTNYIFNEFKEIFEKIVTELNKD